MRHNSLYHEEKLLAQLKNGNSEAFAELFNFYKGTIYSVAYKFLKSPVLADEIVQDVFLKIWVKRNEMGDVKNFNAYLFIMARNFIFDSIKKTASETAAQTELKNEPFYIDDTEYLVRQHECQELLHQAVELLPPQQKQVYHLAKNDGWSHEKIAEQMELSTLTVKTHMAKALQSIRKYLNAHFNSLS